MGKKHRTRTSKMKIPEIGSLLQSFSIRVAQHSHSVHKVNMALHFGTENISSRKIVELTVNEIVADRYPGSVGLSRNRPRRSCAF
jgi:hypothetical protein